MIRARRGFSMVELAVVMSVVGMLLAIIVPHFRPSPTQRVTTAADQLSRDIELVWLRAVTTRNAARMTFTAASQRYTGYLDDNGDGVITESASETAFLSGLPVRTLTDDVIYGQGTAPLIPGFATPGPIAFPNSRIDFTDKGLTTPLGTRGVIYLTSRASSKAVAAVTVTAGAGIRRWVYRNGAWQ
jgi:prepilin-type N-terminal cleavage/methylation domain-containing protein